MELSDLNVGEAGRIKNGRNDRNFFLLHKEKKITRNFNTTEGSSGGNGTRVSVVSLLENETRLKHVNLYFQPT